MRLLVRLVGEFFALFWKDLSDAFNPKAWLETTASLSGLDRKKLIANSRFILPQLFLFYICLSPGIAMPLYDKLLFHPVLCDDGGADSIGKTHRQDLHISVGADRRISAWYFKLAESRGTVLISHGNGGNMLHRYPIYAALLQQGYSVLAFDYEGYGASEGRPSIDNCCRDGLAAYDFLKSTLKEKPERIVLYGESLGGGVSAQIAKQRTCRGLILQSSFYSLPDLASSKFLYMHLYPRILFPKNSLETNKVISAKDFVIPLCLISGTADRIIPVSQSEKLYKIAKDKKLFLKIEGGGHNDLQADEYYEKFKNSLGQALAFFD